jgi:hypothetical protein
LVLLTGVSGCIQGTEFRERIRTSGIDLDYDSLIPDWKTTVVLKADELDSVQFSVEDAVPEEDEDGDTIYVYWFLNDVKVGVKRTFDLKTCKYMKDMGLLTGSDDKMIVIIADDELDPNTTEIMKIKEGGNEVRHVWSIKVIGTCD